MLHRVQYVTGLISDGFQRSTNDVIDLHATGQAEQGAARIRVPVGRTQAGKCRDQINAVAVFHLGREILGVHRVIDDLQFVSQPLHGRAAVEDRAFQRVSHFAARAAADGGEQAVVGFDGFLAGVHQQETAGAVGVFRLARLHTHLAEQRRLLVAGDARDSDAAFAVTVDFGGGFDLG